MMDASEQIRKFQEFFDVYYKAKILEKVSKGESFLVVDFIELGKFDPELAEQLLEHPEDIIKAAEIAIEGIDPEAKRFRVRFRGLLESRAVKIRDIRSGHINKFVAVQGVVRQKSDVRPQVTAARFECPACGNIINILQVDTNFKEPSRCSCGRKGKFHLLGKELVDAQGIVLEESAEDLEGGEQPKRMNIFLKDDLVSPMSEKRTNPGTKIRINGQIKEVPIFTKTGGQSTRFDLMIEANYSESVEEDYSDIAISEEEERQIRELAQDPRLMARLVGSVAPTIYGHEKVKEALLLQLAGGVHKTREGGSMTRGDMHILLIGDPGSGKSQLLKRIQLIAPKGRYVSGKGASAAGLTASVVRDEFLRGWALEAGALVLANKGVCCVDEMDKMSVEDRAAMHEALEQQTISISKANIQATLIARTTVLAAANPKFGRFDPYGVIADQINLPPTLVNRFDLIFPIKDLPDRDKDEKLASFLLGLHQDPLSQSAEIETAMLRKYIAYAKQKIAPRLTDEAVGEIKEYYLKMRGSGGEEGAVKSVPISARQLEALVRFAEASAKIRLSNEVTKEDAQRSIDLLHYCLSQIGVDPETGKIDIDRISTGISATERSKIMIVKDIIAELEASLGKIIPMSDILRAAAAKGVSEDKVEEAVEKLKRSGDIFEPKKDFVQRL